MRVAKVDAMQDFQKCVCITIDEMHIWEGLVFNKNTGAMVEYTDLGDVNNQLLKFERSLTATQSTSPSSACTTTNPSA